MKLDMRMNLKTRKVEIKTKADTEDVGALQKAADFVQAFLLGFEVQDAVALLRLDDLYVEARGPYRDFQDRCLPHARSPCTRARCRLLATQPPSLARAVLRDQGRQDAAGRTPLAGHWAAGGQGRARPVHD